MESKLVCHIDGTSLFGAEQRKTLQNGQLSIGRGAECDWVLPDPDRALSKQHCIIAQGPDGFTLTDTSSNGVYVDGARAPLGRGRSMPLTDGKMLLVGPYRIRVSIEAGSAAVAAALPPALDAAPERWIGEVPAAGFGHGRPPVSARWDGPPDPASLGATGLMTEDVPHALSTLSQQSHAADAISTVIRLPVAKAVLPVDWNAALEDEGAPEPVNPLPPLRMTTPGLPPDASLVDAFTAGAGLAPGSLSAADLAPQFHEFGRMLRFSVLGLRDLLATRKLAKAELRVAATTVKAAGNNALKLSPDAERALLSIAGQALPGFLPGAEAIEEGLRDVKAHELALVATVSVLLSEMTAQLDPEVIKAKVGGGWDLLSASRKARCWDSYEESCAAAGSGASLTARFASIYAEQVAAATGIPASDDGRA